MEKSVSIYVASLAANYDVTSGDDRISLRTASRRLNLHVSTVRQLHADRKIFTPSMLNGSEQRKKFVLAYILTVINKLVCGMLQSVNK
jgi:hypothetical protein